MYLVQQRCLGQQPGILFDLTSGFGGAIFNVGTLIVNDTVLVKNSARGTNYAGGGFGTTGAGGAIYNVGTLVVSNSLFIRNSAVGGHALPNDGFNYGGDGYGGAIFNSDNATIFDCTFSSNSAAGGAGANGLAYDPTIDSQGGVGGSASGAEFITRRCFLLSARPLQETPRLAALAVLAARTISKGLAATVVAAATQTEEESVRAEMSRQL